MSKWNFKFEMIFKSSCIYYYVGDFPIVNYFTIFGEYFSHIRYATNWNLLKFMFLIENFTKYQTNDTNIY